MREPKQEWHLSKSVPLAMIVTIALQTAGAVWWGATIQARTEEHARRLASVESVDADRESEMRDVADRLARLESNGAAQLATLNEIRNTLNRVIWDNRGGLGPYDRSEER